jgi:hypothetical protein
MKIGNEFWLILFQQYINPRLTRPTHRNGWLLFLGVKIWCIWNHFKKMRVLSLCFSVKKFLKLKLFSNPICLFSTCWDPSRHCCSPATAAAVAAGSPASPLLSFPGSTCSATSLCTVSVAWAAFLVLMGTDILVAGPSVDRNEKILWRDLQYYGTLPGD